MKLQITLPVNPTFSIRQYQQCYHRREASHLPAGGVLHLSVTTLDCGKLKTTTRNGSCQQHSDTSQLTLYLKFPEVQPPFFPGRQRQVPTTWTRSPGFTLSTKSSSRITSTERGSWPAGAFSGISWMVMVWWSLQTERPYSVSRGLFSSSWKRHAESSYLSPALEIPHLFGEGNRYILKMTS